MVLKQLEIPIRARGAKLAYSKKSFEPIHKKMIQVKDFL